jgi:DNA-binding transcriptional LysR family regulator
MAKRESEKSSANVLEMTNARGSGRTVERPLDDLGALDLFVHVVDTRSFTAAAKRKGTTTSAVSKRIAFLEQRLGVRLLERTTRHAAPTDAGRVLYEYARRLLFDAVAAEEAVAAYRGELVGTIRVSVAVTFGQMHIAPLIWQFLAKNPGLRVSLSLSDKNADLVSDTIDLAIRSGRAPDSSLLSRKLARDRRVICASPEYLARHGTPRVPDDLRQHVCLRHPLMGKRTGWTLMTRQGSVTVPVSGSFEVDHVGTLRDAAVASMGLILVPAYAITADLQNGLLVSVLDEYAPPPGWFRALWTAGRQPSARISALLAFLARELPLRL